MVKAYCSVVIRIPEPENVYYCKWVEHGKITLEGNSIEEIHEFNRRRSREIFSSIKS